MRFLADEDFPIPSLRLLREADHDVLSISELSPSIDDDVILAQATRQERIVLTFDRDYGELIYKLMQAAPEGVVYFRFNPLFPAESAQILLDAIAKETVFVGRLTVLTRTRVRQRPLP